MEGQLSLLDVTDDAVLVTELRAALDLQADGEDRAEVLLRRVEGTGLGTRCTLLELGQLRTGVVFCCRGQGDQVEHGEAGVDGFAVEVGHGLRRDELDRQVLTGAGLVRLDGDFGDRDFNNPVWEEGESGLDSGEIEIVKVNGGEVDVIVGHVGVGFR